MKTQIALLSLLLCTMSCTSENKISLSSTDPQVLVSASTLPSIDPEKSSSPIEKSPAPNTISSPAASSPTPSPWTIPVFMSEEDMAAGYTLVLNIHGNNKQLQTKSWTATEMKALGGKTDYIFSNTELNTSYEYELFVNEGSCERRMASDDLSVQADGLGVTTDITVIEMNSLTVVALDAQGNPFPNVDIQLAHGGGWSQNLSGKTNTQGEFTFPKIPYDAQTELVLTVPQFAQSLIRHNVSPSCQKKNQELRVQMVPLKASQQDYMISLDSSYKVDAPPKNVKVNTYIDYHLIDSQTLPFDPEPQGNDSSFIQFKKQDLKGQKIHFEVADADAQDTCPSRLFSGGYPEFRPELTQIKPRDNLVSLSESLVILSGQVQDSEGNPLSANVKLTTIGANPQTFNAKTLDNGQYLFDSVPMGFEVQLVVSKPGFSSVNTTFLPSRNRACQLVDNFKTTVLIPE